MIPKHMPVVAREITNIVGTSCYGDKLDKLDS